MRNQFVKAAHWCALFLVNGISLLAVSCSHSSPWNVEAIGADQAFDSSRLCYGDPENISPLTFEMVRLGEQIEAFLSLKQFRFHPDTVLVSLLIEEEKIEREIPVLEGRMKLHLPPEMVEEITEALQQGKEVHVGVDGFEQTLKADRFTPNFKKLLGKIEPLNTNSFKGFES